ncbi:MAG TPA: (2Fe-2S)-binding protein [Phycisphaerae bacterium]|nr:(2Fe-2S)-binding protein [Phycisphaerae bacterium]HNU45699.1 (2Fe-2S)-binding protein [Phycisphaerae bacterium]
MGPDDEVCYCFHVSLRKLLNYSRRVRPQHASQMTACLGAGTGCGWCIPVLTRIAQSPDAPELEAMLAEDYGRQREAYLKEDAPRHTFEE